MIDFLIDQKLQPLWREGGGGGGGGSDNFNMITQNLVNNIRLASCSIKKLHFD